MPLFSGQREAPLVDANIFERELAELSQNTEVPTLSSKKAFEVKDMRLTPRDLQRLSSLLKTKYLTKLSLVGTQILPSGIKELAEGLKDAKNLSVLDLSDNPLGDQGIQTLSLVAKFMPGLREIHLRDTKFTAEGSNSLKELLKLNKRIHVLDLSYNYLGDEGVKKICQGILDTPLGDHSEMIKIMMKNCEVGNQGAQLIGSVLVHVRTLKELDLSGNHIGAEGAKCIAHGLMKKNLIQLIDGENNTSGEASHEFLLEGLEVLDLSDNSLGDDGVKAIAKRLPVNLSLRKLRLVNVGMEAEGLVAVSNSLIEADCVNELYIGDNKVKAGSVSAPVLEMLSKTSCLTALDLSKIQMSADDVKTLGAFLGENIRCRLQHLNLSNCGITDQGCVDVANGIKFNMDLKTLDVTSNPFGASGARSFAKIFRRSKNLEKFYITGHSRIGAEGENYLAECLKYNKKLEIRGATTELDYLSDFVHKGKAFVRNSDGELVGWSEESWNIVKRGCGQIIGTVIYNLNQSDFRTFKKNVLLKSRNVVNQDMFEYVLRHSEAPSMDVVSIFLNKCKIGLDDYCNSKASISMAKEKRMSDDITYRFVAKDCAKDAMVRELAKNNMLFLARYLTENGPAVHQTHEVTRTLAVDLVSDGKPKVFVQVYENELDFMREKESREAMAERLKAGGPFAIYDSILREKEVHEEHSVISFNISITDLRNSIANLGVTAGYDIHETVFLAKRAAQCLGTINNLGRIHGDFRPRNFHKVANKRMGDDPLGRSSKKMLLPDKWVLFDFSKSVPHGTSVALRAESSYIPPEVARVTFNANYQDKQLPLADESMDVWSFGVVLFQLLTGVHLFHVESNTDRIFRDKERMELMNWINLDETRAGLVLHRANESQFQNPSTFKKIKESAIDLLNWCLQGDPHNRPSFNDILTHPFFVYKTNVNYTDVDLLLGWYKSIGSDMAVAKHKNNRTHAHVINTTAAESSDVLKALNYYYKQAGCKVTSDGSDWKLDINVRKELVTKARCLVILMTKDVLWQPHIMQKLIWAIDSNETTSYVLLDISTGFTNAKKFDFDEFIDELEEKKSKSENLSRLLDSLTPVAHKLQLEHMGVGEGKFDEDDVESNKKWLKGFLQTEVKNFLLNMQDKVIPYRTRPFQGQAMANEILNRSGFYAPSSLKPFTLQDNNKEITVGDSGASDGDKKNPNQKAAQVLILYNGSSGDDKIRNDALKLRSKLLGLENKDFKADAVVVGAPNEVYKYFKRGGSASPKLHAERVTLVLCIVSPGFYDSFREVVLHLNSATGMVSVVPIVYGEYDIKDKQAQNEVLNLGIENKAVLNKLKEQKYYIPLPSTGSITKSLEYEVVASLNYIKEEATKQMELAIKNEKKDANEVYSRYENTNFFKFVY